MKSKRDKLIQKLLKNRIETLSDIPEVYLKDREVMKLAQHNGLRKIGLRGYDIISNSFFVEETVVVREDDDEETYNKELRNTFLDFESFYEFLEGDIYENACYYMYEFSKDIINRYQIDLDKINIKSALDYTIDSLAPGYSLDEINMYNEIEQQKSLRRKWVQKYNACRNYEQLVSVIKQRQFSNDKTNEAFYFWNYIYHCGDYAFDVLLPYTCTGRYPSYFIINELCFLYGAQRVLKSYDYVGGVAATNKKHNLALKQTIERIESSQAFEKIVKYFDKATHYFCIETRIYLNSEHKGWPIATLYRYFETFEQFVRFLEYDLSDCDLSQALNLNLDFSGYITNGETRLPISSYSELQRVVCKRYNRQKECFEVDVAWYDLNGILVTQKSKEFKYFFDFVYFLNYDLSDADLLFCDGLNNITNFCDLNFTNARLQSWIAEKHGCLTRDQECHLSEIKNFSLVNFNETETLPTFQTDRTEGVSCGNFKQESRVLYVSDLHLMHRLNHANCKTKNDCIYVVQRIVDSLLDDIRRNDMLLIGGDVASEFWLYKLFVELLRKTLDEYHSRLKVFFVLGNHDLWSFGGCQLEAIVEEYRKLLEDNNMHLLHNDLVYLSDDNEIFGISENALKTMEKNILRNKMRTARTVILGGIGFSGYNDVFNANNGIYRSVVSRDEEIAESKKFEALYERVSTLLPEKNVIVLTHMPLKDWHRDGKCKENFVYTNGHNHRNYFYDDGVHRIYSDNQVGYNTEHQRSKYFYIGNTYDWFAEYDDGIHMITREDYIDFHRGKNIPITFNRKINRLYMLKKNGYYCFLHENFAGGLSILNGGRLKSLKIEDIRWYYDNMDSEIARIIAPLEKYTSIQTEISKLVVQIGGDGNIHGAIIDIDFYNHIFLNPHDLKITPYCAVDIIDKYVYPDIPSLLEANCPELYCNYTRLLSSGQISAIVPKGRKNKLVSAPTLYLETDIYAASREIKKMQKLNSNILTTWYDDISVTTALPES